MKDDWNKIILINVIIKYQKLGERFITKKSWSKLNYNKDTLVGTK